MAYQGGTSRLAQMQMRFQQKQQEERERRKIEMTSATVTNNISSINTNTIIRKNKNNSIATTTTTTAPVKTPTVIDNDKKSLNSTSIAPGKVRQMFDQRRQRSTGIDKSYPLKPINQPKLTNTLVSTAATTTSIMKTSKSSSRASSTSSINKELNSTFIRQKNDILNGNTTNFYNNIKQDTIEDETFPTTDDFEIPLSKKLTGTTSIKRNINVAPTGDGYSGDKNNNATISSNNTALKKQLKPVLTKKQPPLQSEGILNKTFVFKKEPPSEPILKRTFDIKSAKDIKSPNSRTAINNSETKVPLIPKETQGDDGLSSCGICGRRFNSDRLKKHEQICQKSTTKKRRVFDSLKHRVAGTEAEKYVKKTIKSGGNSVKPLTTTNPNKINTTGGIALGCGNAKKQSNWRKTHEDFIQTIRSAKKMQQHLAKGGKLSDLPPPPPSENLDYIQCPHCLRKFNQAAAERHIPKCSTFRHNKPKPVAGSSTAAKRRY